MNDIEILAREVLNMISLQEEHKVNNLTAKYCSKKVDTEEMHNTFLDMLKAEIRVREMCMDILGIEEEE